MEQKTITLTYKDFSNILQGFIIAMKELDKYENGLDRIFADRLEIICQKIEIQVQ